jgi:hypothetical protein
MPTLTELDRQLIETLGENRNRGQQRIINAVQRATGATWRQIVTVPTPDTTAAWVQAIRAQTTTFVDVVASTTDAYLSLWLDTTQLADVPSINLNTVIDEANTIGMWEESPIKRLRALIPVRGFDEAKAEAERYAQRLAVLEAAQADLYVARAFAAEVGLRWRRVPNPNACGFCRVVADRIYTSIDSIQLHAFCRCHVAPWHPDVDPFRPGDLAGGDWQRIIKEPARDAEPIV